MPLAPALTAWKTYRRGAVAADLPIRACAAGAIPSDCADRLERLVAPLVAAGFVHALDVGPTDEHAPLTNHARVLWHPSERLRAWAIDIVTAHATATYLELATRFAGGHVVVTLNPDTPAIFEKPPWVKETRLPGAGVPELLAAHRLAVAATDDSPIEPWDEDPLATARAENAAVLVYQKERGVLRDAGGDAALGYTRRGATRSVLRIWRSMR